MTLDHQTALGPTLSGSVADTVVHVWPHNKGAWQVSMALQYPPSSCALLFVLTPNCFVRLHDTMIQICRTDLNLARRRHCEEQNN